MPMNAIKTNLYSTADPNVYSLPADEKKAIIKIDCTQLKEDITYYISRSDELRAEVGKFHEIFCTKRDDYASELRSKESEIKAISDNINLISTKLQKLRKPHEISVDD
jgi:uncharacterized coiled-coil DUF342 family protein